jgi:hypothetical protein
MHDLIDEADINAEKRDVHPCSASSNVAKTRDAHP